MKLIADKSKASVATVAAIPIEVAPDPGKATYPIVVPAEHDSISSGAITATSSRITFDHAGISPSDWSINKSIRQLMASDPIADAWVKTAVIMHLENAKRRALDHANVDTTLPVPDQWVKQIGTEITIELYRGRVHVMVHKGGEE